jgi:hypothetical protein
LAGQDDDSDSDQKESASAGEESNEEDDYVGSVRLYLSLIFNFQSFLFANFF